MQLAVHTCLTADEGGAEIEAVTRVFRGDTLQVRVEVGRGAECEFAFAEDGGAFATLGPTFRAKSSTWVGAKVGLFASASHVTPNREAGYADVSWFRVAGLPS